MYERYGRKASLGGAFFHSLLKYQKDIEMCGIAETMFSAIM